jgi:hydroxypyruvate isomerase
MPRFAANLSMMYNEVPFLERFAAAAADGFEAVEFLFPYDYPPEVIAACLADNGLVQALFNLPPGDWAAGERGMACHPGREAQFVQSVQTALIYAIGCGCRKVHAMAGLLPAGVTPAQARATYVANLRAAARILAPHGITLLIEPINTRNMPGYFLNFQQQAHDVVSDVGQANLKVQMDFYHCQVMEGDLARRLHKHFAGVGHVQIAGVPDRHEPDSGEVAYGYLFDQLDTLGYTGWVGCEYIPAGATSAGLGWLRDYRRRTAV